MKERESFYWYMTKDKLGDFMQYLGFVGLLLIGLFVFRQKTGEGDLRKISGTFEKVTKELNPGSKLKKSTYSDMDVLEFIHLRGYGCKFQISYGVYNEDKFEREAKPGDLIAINIDKADIKNLGKADTNIRGFSLELNGQSFLNEKDTVSLLTTGNIWFIAIGTMFIGAFGLYARVQYKEWKK